MLVYVYAFVRVGLLRACVYMRVAASVCVHVSVLRLRPDVGVYVVRTRSDCGHAFANPVRSAVGLQLRPQVEDPQYQ